MIARLWPVALVVLTVAGCGGSSGESANPAGQDQTVEATEAHQDNLPAEKANGDADAEEAEEPDVANSTAAGVAGEKDGPMRTWSDPAGKTLVKAEFIDLMDGKVCLQKENGEGVLFALDELSQADREYVKSRAIPSTPPPAEKEEPAEDQPAAEDLAEEAPVSSTTKPAKNHQRAARKENRQAYSSGKQKVVIPFDFVSKFDKGRYGQMVGDMIWKKLDREGGVIIPETMLDVRDFCAGRNLHLGPDTPMEKVQHVVREDFGAHVGIWGSVERVEGHEWDVYDLVIKCVDFSAYPDPKVIYECTARTNTVSEIPHLYVKQMLDKLYDRKPGGPPPVNKIAEENWVKNPNLVVGDFQSGSGGAPKGWESRGGQQREPLGGLVSWVPEGGNAENRLIRFKFPAAVGDSEGVMYYSGWFPVEEGARYRFQCRWRSNGPAVKVFIKCYDAMGSQYKESQYKPTAGRPRAKGSKENAYRPGNNYVPEAGQRREVYRSQQNLKGPKNTWNVQTEDFTPKHTKYTPRWGRVMLYAYLGAGVVEFDDVVLKQILPASPGEHIKERRHSLETRVTLEEMEENERRGRELREKRRQEGEGKE